MIPAMIARHRLASRANRLPTATSQARMPRALLAAGLWLAMLPAMPAQAEEAATAPATVATDPASGDAAEATPAGTGPAARDATLDAPFSALPGSDAPFDPDFRPEFDPGFGNGFEPGYGEGFDPDASTTATTTPSPPDYPAPKIDAYVDLSISESDFGKLGYDDNVAGYRLLFGFRLEEVGGGKWTLAPEVGYLRIGKAERDDISTDAISDSEYYLTITDNHTLDATALSFGGRIGWLPHPRVEPYLRAGLHFYHALDRIETTFSYEPKAPLIPPKPQTTTSSQSEVNVGLDIYASLGFAWRLGKVPSLYAEYGAFAIENEVVTTGAVGFLLNF